MKLRAGSDFIKIVGVCFLLVSSGWIFASEYIAISMIELIADGNTFNGKYIEVVGVPSVDFEASFLYSTREAYEVSDTAASIFMRISPEIEKNMRNYNGKHVRITGRYLDIERRNLQKNEFSIGPPQAAGIIEIDSVELIPIDRK